MNTKTQCRRQRIAPLMGNRPNSVENGAATQYYANHESHYDDFAEFG